MDMAPASETSTLRGACQELRRVMESLAETIFPSFFIMFSRFSCIF